MVNKIGTKTRIMYVEQKEGDCLAWIGRVKFSKSGRSIYYREFQLQRTKGGGIAGNFFDVETGEEYWVSGPKKNRQDLHWADGGGPVHIDDDVRDEYLELIA